MIVFKDVSKTFRTDSGEVRALQHIGLTIRDGDIQGIIGFPVPASPRCCV